MGTKSSDSSRVHVVFHGSFLFLRKESGGYEVRVADSGNAHDYRIGVNGSLIGLVEGGVYDLINTKDPDPAGPNPAESIFDTNLIIAGRKDGVPTYVEGQSLSDFQRIRRYCTINISGRPLSILPFRTAEISRYSAGLFGSIPSLFDFTAPHSLAGTLVFTFLRGAALPQLKKGTTVLWDAARGPLHIYSQVANTFKPATSPDSSASLGGHAAHAAAGSGGPLEWHTHDAMNTALELLVDGEVALDPLLPLAPAKGWFLETGLPEGLANEDLRSLVDLLPRVDTNDPPACSSPGSPC